MVVILTRWSVENMTDAALAVFATSKGLIVFRPFLEGLPRAQCLLKVSLDAHAQSGDADDKSTQREQDDEKFAPEFRIYPREVPGMQGGKQPSVIPAACVLAGNDGRVCRMDVVGDRVLA